MSHFENIYFNKKIIAINIKKNRNKIGGQFDSILLKCFRDGSFCSGITSKFFNQNINRSLKKGYGECMAMVFNNNKKL